MEYVLGRTLFNIKRLQKAAKKRQASTRANHVYDSAIAAQSKSNAVSQHIKRIEETVEDLLEDEEFAPVESGALPGFTYTKV